MHNMHVTYVRESEYTNMSCKVENAFSQELYGLIKHRLDAQASKEAMVKN